MWPLITKIGTALLGSVLGSKSKGGALMGNAINNASNYLNSTKRI